MHCNDAWTLLQWTHNQWPTKYMCIVQSIQEKELECSAVLNVCHLWHILRSASSWAHICMWRHPILILWSYGWRLGSVLFWFKIESFWGNFLEGLPKISPSSIRHPPAIVVWILGWVLLKPELNCLGQTKSGCLHPLPAHMHRLEICL